MRIVIFLKLFNIFGVILNSFEALNLILDLKELLGELFVFLFGILMASLISFAHETCGIVDDLVPVLSLHADHEGDHGQFEGGVDSSEGGHQIPRIFVLDKCQPVGRVIVNQF